MTDTPEERARPSGKASRAVARAKRLLLPAKRLLLRMKRPLLRVKRLPLRAMQLPTRARRLPLHARRLPNRARRLPRWWLLPACALVGALAGGLYGAVKTPQYTATSYVIAVPTPESDPSTALGFAQAYGRVATQLAVLNDAQVAAGVPLTTLQEDVRAETSPDAPMVAVSATSAEPRKAARIANAVARALTVNANRTQDDTRVQLLQFSRALKPTEPSSATTALTSLVGLCAGGLLGGLALLVRPRRTVTEQPAATPAGAPVPVHVPVLQGSV